MHLTEAGGTLDAETEGVQFQLQITDTRNVVAKFDGPNLPFSSMSRSCFYVQVICFNLMGFR